MTNGNGLKHQILNILSVKGEMTADELVREVEKNSTATITHNGNGKIRHKAPKYKLNTIGRIKGACRHLAIQNKIAVSKTQIKKDINVNTFNYKMA